MQFIFQNISRKQFKRHKYLPVILPFILIFIAGDIYSAEENFHQKSNNQIIDYRSHVSKRFKKIKRKSTKFIIVHTSECDLEKTLKIVSKGKENNGVWISRGGHTHYVIALNGTIYRILEDKFKATHAGLSMWNGLSGLNNHSIGIELVGYHYDRITNDQYESVSYLIKKIKRKYDLKDRDVLTHSQVAYSKPNEWVKKNHRGRKYCASNFDRKMAGLNSGWSFDPDVKSGRLLPDLLLAAIFYRKLTQSDYKPQKPCIIDSTTTAWAIAGNKYNSSNTIYKFPSGWIISGNRIAKRVGWDSIPDGTVVYID
jgi:hypothetical protein